MAAAVTHSKILVGFKPIDDLHREFEAILEALNDPAEADYGAHLLALHEHLLRHCETEEKFMLQENYSHYERHRRAHEHLLDSVSDVRRKFDAGDVAAVQRYSSDLMNWFAIHASTEDTELVAFLKGQAT
ncbi:MAG TPA: hemerythrin family protein [Burkholderiaceae bacterium]|nr:hemerythrin family protein [Burkholderiaceae bacterium]HQR69390.1 hemerythrin family protein [Burkholderiaceae bacterium]